MEALARTYGTTPSSLRSKRSRNSSTHLITVQRPLCATDCLTAPRTDVHHSLRLLRVLLTKHGLSSHQPKERTPPTRLHGAPSWSVIRWPFLGTLQLLRRTVHFPHSPTLRLHLFLFPSENEKLKNIAGLRRGTSSYRKRAPLPKAPPSARGLTYPCTAAQFLTLNAVASGLSSLKEKM